MTDTVLADTVTPDTVTPDTATPDTVAPDTLSPDSAETDAEVADTESTDIASADTEAVDTVVADDIASEDDTVEALDTSGLDTAAEDTVEAADTILLDTGEVGDVSCNVACAHGGSCIPPGGCDCEGTGYEGATCETPTCSMPCANGGTCSAPDTCDCAGTGYAGATCETPTCVPPCANGGTCSAPDTCDCAETGYEGATCETPTCVPPCAHGGTCSAPDTCDCGGTGYEGATCETPTCSMPCANGGTCAAPNTCDCAETGYEGATCGTPACSTPCANGGTCSAPDTCDCAGTGYEGATCEAPACESPCQHGGLCVAPNTCDCSGTGFTGADCGEATCPGGCDDADPCTVDACVSGACEHSPVACDDGSACTTDTCVLGHCRFAPVVDGMVCDDGDAATDADSCLTGACTAAVTGSCADAPDGALCDDGDAATSEDRCDGGSCAGVTAPTCPVPDPGSVTADGSFAQGAACWTSVVEATGTGEVAVDGAQYDADSPSLRLHADAASTIVLVYQRGVAVARGRFYELRFSARAETTGALQVRLQSDQSPHEDLGLDHEVEVDSIWSRRTVRFVASATHGNGRLVFRLAMAPATVWLDDIVVAPQGVLSWSPCEADADCNDGDPCTAGTCRVALGCEVRNATGPCDDGNPCTADDACWRGQCVGGTCDDACGGCNTGWTCIEGFCVEDQGCTADSDCTVTDFACQEARCIEGACVRQRRLDTCASDSCGFDLCGAWCGACLPGENCDSGTCRPLPQDCIGLEDGARCDDDDPCTANDTCSDGTCAGEDIAECMLLPVGLDGDIFDLPPSVDFPDGLEVEVPPGAVPDYEVLAIAPASEDVELGAELALTQSVRLEPSGFVPAVPLVLTLPINPNLPETVIPETALAVIQGAPDSPWEALDAAATFDPATATVIVEVPHFSSVSVSGMRVYELASPACSSFSSFPSVLLVHGFFGDGGALPGTWGQISPLAGSAPLLDARWDLCVRAVDYTMGSASSIAVNADRLERVVLKIATLPGRPWGPPSQVVIVAHSMGGLVTRHMLQKSPNAQTLAAIVRGVVTLGTPHQGATALHAYYVDLACRASDAQFAILHIPNLCSIVSPNTSMRQMLPNSDYLLGLNAQNLPNLVGPAPDYVAVCGGADTLVPTEQCYINPGFGDTPNVHQPPYTSAAWVHRAHTPGSKGLPSVARIDDSSHPACGLILSEVTDGRCSDCQAACGIECLSGADCDADCEVGKCELGRCVHAPDDTACPTGTCFAGQCISNCACIGTSECCDGCNPKAAGVSCGSDETRTVCQSAACGANVVTQRRGHECDGIWSACPSTPGAWTTTAVVQDCALDQACSPTSLMCVPATTCCTATTCDELGKACGDWPDGCGGSVSCGTCVDGETCTDGHCGCAPTSCAALAATCGEEPDGCGGTLSCGTCPTGYDCVDGTCVCDGAGCASGTIAIDVTGPAPNGVQDLVWDVAVFRDVDQQLVAQERVTTSSHGGADSLVTLDMPCDPTDPIAVNVVSVWVVGAYAATVSNPGSFAWGDPSGIAETTLPLYDPTSDGPIQVALACAPGATVDADITLTLARPVEPGFFDRAVNFGGLYCTARFDCCDDADHDGCEPGEELETLIDESGQLGPTMRLTFACTDGLNYAAVPELVLDDLLLECAAGALAVDPGGWGGDQCPVEAINGCPIFPVGGELADTFLFQVRVDRDYETVGLQEGDIGVATWSVSLGVKPDIATCRLHARAFADETTVVADGVDDGTIAPGVLFPLIVWDLPLDASCGSEGLASSGDGAPIDVQYTAIYGPGFSLDLNHRWRPKDGPPPDACEPPCSEGQTCVWPGICACVPKTCVELHKGCGTWDDGCGGTLFCDLCDATDCDAATGECACTADTPSACAPGAECGQYVDWCAGTTFDCGTCLGTCDLATGQCQCQNDAECAPAERCDPIHHACVGAVVEVPPVPLLMGCTPPTETASCSDDACRACTCQAGTCCPGQGWSWDCAVRAGALCPDVCGCATAEACCRLVPYCTPLSAPPTMVNGMSSYQVDVNHVTAAEYSRCVAHGVCSAVAAPTAAPPDTSAWSFETASTFRAPGRGDHPINYVTWAQAMTYCSQWAGGHLCTEAEWENAARGTPPDAPNPYPWGATPTTAPGDFCRYGVINGVHGSSSAADAGCGRGGTAPVGSAPLGASVLGVMGLAGNVKDHVRDAFRPFPCATDTGAPCAIGGTDGVVRGAAFFEHDVDMFTYRRTIWPRDARSPGVGFRCCFGPLQ